MDLVNKTTVGTAALLEHTWTLECLDIFNHVRTPCWISSFEKGSEFVKPIWANSAAHARFGQFCSKEEQQERLSVLDPEALQMRREQTSRVFREVVDGLQICRTVVHMYRHLCFVYLDVPPTDDYYVIFKKPIKMEIDGEVRTVVMSELEQEASPEIARATSMMAHIPTHTFLFDSEGALLHASDKAMARHQHLCADGELTLADLFKQGIWQGGVEEMIFAYNQAMDAIFVHGNANHRVLQQRTSRKKPGQMRWVLYEMWPMQDPVTLQNAVLISATNVTAQKEAELKLKEWQDILEQQNQELVKLNEDLAAEKSEIQEQKEELLVEKSRLSQHLEEIMNTGVQSSCIDVDTPADKTLNMLNMLVRGHMPTIADIMELHNMILSAGDLREPVQLGKQLLEDATLDTDVGMAMAQLLTSGNESGHAVPQHVVRKKVQSVRRRRSSCLNLDDVAHMKPSDRTSSSSRNLSVGSGSDPDDLPLSYITPTVEQLLQGAETTWTYNMFALADAAPGAPLATVAFFLMKQTGTISKFQLSERKLSNFLHRIEDGYADNPYHSRIHAASVLQTMHMLLHHGGLKQNGIVEGVASLACYIAAAVHDFEHGGVNNDFLMRTKDPLAITYNDVSPLENHHLAAAFRLLQLPQYNFLEKLPEVDQLAFRSTVIEQVLATDMKKHFNILSRFQMTFQRAKHETKHETLSPQPPLGASGRHNSVSMAESSGRRSAEQTVSPSGTTRLSFGSRQSSLTAPDAQRTRTTASFSMSAAEANKVRGTLRTGSTGSTGCFSEPLNADQRSLAQQMALKCADIGHLAASPDVHKRWASQLEEEFFRQGDREKEKGLSISALMDRSTKAGITKSQVGFYDIVGIPLFTAFSEVFEGAQPLLASVFVNYANWGGTVTPQQMALRAEKRSSMSILVSQGSTMAVMNRTSSVAMHVDKA